MTLLRIEEWMRRTTFGITREGATNLPASTSLPGSENSKWEADEEEPLQMTPIATLEAPGLRRK